MLLWCDLVWQKEIIHQRIKMKFKIFLLYLLCCIGTGCSESREDKYIRVNTELAKLEAQKKSVNLKINEFLYPDGSSPLEEDFEGTGPKYDPKMVMRHQKSKQRRRKEWRTEKRN